MVISGHTDIGTVTRALRLAADDYLRRPFHLKEFGLRLEALLRRHGPGILAIAYSRSKAIHLNELSIDVGSGAISKAAPPVSLTERERLALTTLIESAPQPISRNELSRRLKLDEEHSAQTLSSLMRHLRTKIARLGVRGNPIRAVRGFGYRLTQSRRLQRPPGSRLPALIRVHPCCLYERPPLLELRLEVRG